MPIPIAIPSPESFRNAAIDVLWPSTADEVRKNVKAHQQEFIDVAAKALCDAWVDGAAAVIEHQSMTTDVVEKPKDRTWLVTVTRNSRAVEEQIVAPNYLVTEDGLLLFGTAIDDCLTPDVACFAAGHWTSVVRQPDTDPQNPVVR